jgi:hypothetical protein
MSTKIKVWWRNRNLVWVGDPDNAGESVTVKRPWFFGSSDEDFVRAIKDEIDRQEKWNESIEKVEEYLRG